MAWMRLEVSYIDHPKFLALSDGAFRLWHEGKCYCERHLTDGLIPRVAVKGFPHVTDRRLQELQTIVAGYTGPLWEDHVMGFLIHDYLQHNDCREMALARIARSDEERAMNRRRKSVSRDRSLIQLVRSRDGDDCRYCGQRVSWTDRKGTLAGTYDHINPGGGDSLRNVVVCCRGCNSRKGNRSLSEIASLGMLLRPSPNLAGFTPGLSQEGQINKPSTPSPSPAPSAFKKEQSDRAVAAPRPPRYRDDDEPNYRVILKTAHDAIDIEGIDADLATLTDATKSLCKLRELLTDPQTLISAVDSAVWQRKHGEGCH